MKIYYIDLFVLYMDIYEDLLFYVHGYIQRLYMYIRMTKFIYIL